MINKYDLMVVKEFNVLWTQTAIEDLDDIINYIANDSIESSKKIFYQIKKKSENLKTFPNRGRIIPELKYHNIETYREIIIDPWRLFYRIEKNNVYVLSIIDGRRNIEDILMTKFLSKKFV